MPVSRACIGVLLLACVQIAVAEKEIPDMELLEYLGSWEGSDEDWVMFAELATTWNEIDTRSDPAPDGEETTETYDEE